VNNFIIIGYCLALIFILANTKFTFKINKKNLHYLLIISLYALIAYAFFVDTLTAHDNFHYTFPYFDYIYQAVQKTGTFPLWNPFLNHGEPTFLFINHNFLTHYPNIFIYLLSPMLVNLKSSNVFWISIHLGIIIQAIGFTSLVHLIFKNHSISAYALIMSLFSGLAFGEFHQFQINATMLYIPWQLFFLILWMRKNESIFLFLFCFFFGYSLTNHYPHLILYFWLFLLISVYFFKKDAYKTFINKIMNEKKIILFYGILLFFVAFLPTLLIFYEYHNTLVSPYRMEAISSDNPLTSAYSFILAFKDTNSFNIHTIFHFLFPKTLSTMKLGQYTLDNSFFYIGIIPILFCFVSFFAFKEIKYLIFLLIIFLLIGSGGYSFGYLILYNYLPFSDYHRLPLQNAFFITPLLIFLSTYGLSYCLKNEFVFLKSKNIQFSILIFICLALIYFTISLLMFTFKNHYLSFLRYLFDEIIIIFLSIGALYAFLINKKFFNFLLIFLVFTLSIIFSFYSFKVKTNNIFNIANYDKKFERYDVLEKKYESDPYLGMLEGISTFNINAKPMVMNKEYYQFREKLIDSSQNHWLMNRFLFIPEKIYKKVTIESIGDFYNKNEIFSPDFSSKFFSSNEIKLELNSKESGFIIFLNNNDQNWVLQNNFNNNIEKFGPFMMVKIHEGRNKLFFIYSPVWRWALFLNYFLILLFTLLFLNRIFNKTLFK